MDKQFYASIIFLGMSIIFKIFNPKKINRFGGYRTFQSMKSTENWIYANTMAANFYLGLTIFLFVFSLMGNLLDLDYNKYFFAIGFTGFVATFIFIEFKLRFNSK